MKDNLEIMNVLFRTICCFLFCASMGFSQEKPIDALASKSDEQVDYLLFTEMPDLEFEEGSKLHLEVILKNKTEKIIYFIRGFELNDFSVEIKDEKGKITSRSQKGRIRDMTPKGGSRYLVQLKPKEDYQFMIDLSELYELQKGSYTITATRMAIKEDKETSFQVKLKPTKLLIY